MTLGLTETLALLAEARRFVAEGERLVSKQRDVVQILERDGYDTLDAIEHLELLEEMQAEYLDHLEKLERRVLVLVRPEA
jgi:Txe/YoeB family toxin of Txe-Axe toxin-antitoxin module